MGDTKCPYCQSDLSIHLQEIEIKKIDNNLLYVDCTEYKCGNCLEKLSFDTNPVVNVLKKVLLHGLRRLLWVRNL